MVVLNWSWLRIVIIRYCPGPTLTGVNAETMKVALPVGVLNLPFVARVVRQIENVALESGR